MSTPVQLTFWPKTPDEAPEAAPGRCTQPPPPPKRRAGPAPGAAAPNTGPAVPAPPPNTAPNAANARAPKAPAPGTQPADGGTADVDALLQRVIQQARALGIPVSGRIRPQVRLNRRAKKRFGCCIGSPQLGYTIELAAALPAAGQAVCLQTLAHEVLHTCPNCQNHGPLWKRYAAQMGAAYGYNIHRTDKPEALGVQLPAAAPPHYRWRITCTACGRQFLRQKVSPLVRYPARYRCAACGGRLRVEALPQ